MSVVSSPRRQKSWQIADEIASLLDVARLEREQLGAKLRQLAQLRNLGSDEEAARLVGVSYRQYQRWLSGESEPRASSLKQIAERFAVPLSELLGQPDPSQLDRIEGMLKRLLGEDAQQVSPEEEVEGVIGEIESGSAEGAGGDQPSGAKPPRNGAAAPASSRRPGASRRAR